MITRFKWSEPAICTWQEDTSKPWFIYFDFTDNQTGITKRLQFRGLINKTKDKRERLAQANALIRYWKRQLKYGWTPFDQTITNATPAITEAFDTIYKLKESNCSSRTLESYRYCLKLFKDWLVINHMAGINVDRFQVNHARAFFDYLALNKGYSGRTYNDKITVLSTFANEMIDREWINKNPFRKIKKVPIGVGRNIAFDDGEKEELKKYLQENDRQLYYFTQFIHYCFIRRSELTRLKIENIDFANRTIIIPSYASKNKKQESVVIPDSFWPVLEEMNLAAFPKTFYIFGRRLQPCAVPYINYNHISSRHNQVSQALGIDTEKGLYSWKHSGVCALYAATKDIYAIMRQCRHSDIKTTQIYLKSLGLIDNNVVRVANW
jgi:integrase